MIPPPPCSPEQHVLERLAFAEASGCGVAGFSHPETCAAALSLQSCRIVECWEGQGRDLGLLLVRRRAFQAGPRPIPPSGGEAA